VKARLIRSSGGVFEVALDGKVLYSKKKTGEFPEDEAIVREVRARKAG
jgi:selT/selW/selH-like putative selenoprotein